MVTGFYKYDKHTLPPCEGTSGHDQVSHFHVPAESVRLVRGEVLTQQHCHNSSGKKNHRNYKDRRPRSLIIYFQFSIFFKAVIE